MTFVRSLLRPSASPRLPGASARSGTPGPLAIRLIIIALGVCVQLAGIVVWFVHANPRARDAAPAPAALSAPLSAKIQPDSTGAVTDSNERIAAQTADRLGAALAPVRQILDTARSHIVEANLDADDPFAIESMLLAELKAQDMLDRLGFVHEDGRITRLLRTEGGGTRTWFLESGRAVLVERNAEGDIVRIAEDLGAPIVDPDSRPWYRAARSAGKPIWTDAFELSFGGRRAIAYAQVIRTPEGRSIGTLSGFVELDRLPSLYAHQRTHAGDERTSEGGEVSVDIVDANGSLLLGALRGGSPDGIKLSARIPIKGEGSPRWRVIVSRDATPVIAHSAGRPAAIPASIPASIPAAIPTPQADAASPGPPRSLQSQALMLAFFLCALAVLLTFLASRSITRLQRMAVHDELTGACTREELERVVRTRLASEGSVLVIAIDLDDFKAINDGLGHASGDAVLVEVTRRLLTMMGNDGAVARRGGDEFLVVLRASSNLQPKDQRRAAVAVHDALTTAPIETTGLRIPCRATIGYAFGAADAIDRLVDDADHALVHGKLDAKNGCHAAKPSQRPPGLVADDSGLSGPLVSTPATNASNASIALGRDRGHGLDANLVTP